MDKNNYMIPLAIVVAGVLVAGGIFLSKGEGGNQNNNNNNGTAEEIDLDPVTNDDYILGSPEADIIVVEYSDLECPFCKDFHEVMHSVIDEYGKDGEVAWVYRHFPITSIHPKAPQEALAAECAGDIGGNNAFWAYLDKIFEITPSNNGLNLDLLPEVAEDIGLDVDDFNACMESGEFQQNVQDDFDGARRAGATGTPYSVVISRSGEMVALPGSVSLQNMRSLIEQLLQIEATAGSTDSL